jgi:hypothetical protein
MKLFSSLESLIEPWKSYFNPRAHGCYRRLISQTRGPSDKVAPNPNRPVDVLLDISGYELDRDLGRLAYFLFVLFHFSGFQVHLRDRFRFLATMQRKHFKRFLFNYPLNIVSGPEGLRSGFWWVTDRCPNLVPSACERLLILDYAIRPPTQDDIVLPYMFSPTVYEQVQNLDISRYQNETRPYKVFFAGSINYRYKRAQIEKRYSMLSRSKVIECVCNRFGSDALVQFRSLNELESMGKKAHNKIILLAADAPLLTTSEWLTCLGKSRAFLAAPGVHMPLSHNLWESLALGTLPVLEYPQYLTPSLKHGINAWVYHGADELTTRLQQLLTEPDGRFEPMAQAAHTYYTKWGSPSAFLNRLRSSSDTKHSILVNSFEAPRKPFRSSAKPRGKS